jgi:hypothetical protein
MDELGFPSLTGYVQGCKALIVSAGAKPVNTFTVEVQLKRTPRFGFEDDAGSTPVNTFTEVE